MAARDEVLGGGVSMATGVNIAGGAGHGGAPRSAGRVRAGPEGGRYRGAGPAGRAEQSPDLPFPRGCGASPALPHIPAGRPRALSHRPARREPASAERGRRDTAQHTSLSGSVNKQRGRLSRTARGASGRSVSVARATLTHGRARNSLSDSCSIYFAIVTVYS